MILGNFTWDWIYRELARQEPGFAPLAELFAADYAAAISAETALLLNR